MFNNYTCNAVTGAAGGYTLRFGGLDMAALRVECVLGMMLKDGVITRQSKVKIGATGRLREVYDCKTQKAYRMWGKTYYGCVSK